MVIDMSRELLLVSEISLEQTGLISNKSDGIRKFIQDNGIKTVTDFLSVYDMDMGDSIPYSDERLEIKGLADLLRYKYFNVSPIFDVYLEKPIRVAIYNIYGEKHRLLGVEGFDSGKSNIYSVLMRLGFNGLERDLILDRDIDSLCSMFIGEVLYNVYMELSNKEVMTDFDVVLCNKILIVLSCYRRVVSESRVSHRYQVRCEMLLGELGRLIGIDNKLSLKGNGKSGRGR